MPVAQVVTVLLEWLVVVTAMSVAALALVWAITRDDCDQFNESDDQPQDQHHHG